LLVRDLSCGDTRIFLEIEVRRVQCRSCGKVKRERLDFLADNLLYTKRFRRTEVELFFRDLSPCVVGGLWLRALMGATDFGAGT